MSIILAIGNLKSGGSRFEAGLGKIVYKTHLQNNQSKWRPVAHAYNATYSGGRDQEDHGSKPAQRNSL
jgi:hypothetical protein